MKLLDATAAACVETWAAGRNPGWTPLQRRALCDSLLALSEAATPHVVADTVLDDADAQRFLLRRALDLRFSVGEPQPRAGGDGIARLDRARFQGRRWATRARPWADRLACAWLIRRFVDAEARFVWLAAREGEAPRTPRGAIGFDYDGARFSHVGARVSFEVIAASFDLDTDPRLQRIGATVHYLDIGGIPAPEAAGLESVLAGLRELHYADDDALLAAACTVFDALYAAPEAAS